MSSSIRSCGWGSNTSPLAFTSPSRRMDALALSGLLLRSASGSSADVAQWRACLFLLSASGTTHQAMSTANRLATCDVATCAPTPRWVELRDQTRSPCQPSGRARRRTSKTHGLIEGPRARLRMSAQRIAHELAHLVLTRKDLLPMVIVPADAPRAADLRGAPQR